ncbi:MAG: flavodoxin family protein [Theionarchaea archaeon]|nr:flavodoxin family protein [Theionarchaea archaeon]
MKSIVAYDSVYGNTEKVAKAIGEALGEDARVLHADQVDASELGSLDLLIVGTPTHGGRPTKPVANLLGKIPSNSLQGTSVAAFDTRSPKTWVKIFGFAAPKVAGKLKKKGGTLVKEPEPFFVDGTEGPLSEGELERAASWAGEIAGGIS